ncbi:hypothetical protein SAMN05192539_1008212 [Paraburkholderia diazotrophica]|uniref:Uncharacterized protein n=1 Tax=Paraburkholderia diazotrophica TaxID=667676 RepID=A0A1H6XIP2_9BURK|nr:hypothetical protein SAMN05192539_1008212 [Paraburkholderia diazotrophica]
MVQLVHENLAQPGCNLHALEIPKSGCNAGKPCAFNNIARRIIGVTMRAFSRLQGLGTPDFARRRRPI